jgi:hypothetical protein
MVEPDEVDKCLHCWRCGPERDGCNCVLELTPTTHPEHRSFVHFR